MEDRVARDLTDVRGDEERVQVDPLEAARDVRREAPLESVRERGVRVAHRPLEGALEGVEPSLHPRVDTGHIERRADHAVDQDDAELSDVGVDVEQPRHAGVRRRRARVGAGPHARPAGELAVGPADEEELHVVESETRNDDLLGEKPCEAVVGFDLCGGRDRWAVRDREADVRERRAREEIATKRPHSKLEPGRVGDRALDDPLGDAPPDRSHGQDDDENRQDKNDREYDA